MSKREALVFSLEYLIPLSNHPAGDRTLPRVSVSDLFGLYSPLPVSRLQQSDRSPPTAPVDRTAAVARLSHSSSDSLSISIVVLARKSLLWNYIIDTASVLSSFNATR
ncbi:hypothetical protein K1719_038849 [Acacia pycnantha]|nr:hypothetical protein K1719_038849 [Acacia pycnantha]